MYFRDCENTITELLTLSRCGFLASWVFFPLEKGSHVNTKLAKYWQMFEKGNKLGKKFPEQSNEGSGRPKTKKFKEILDELAGEEYTMTFPLEVVEIDHNKKTVKIKLPSDLAIAANLRRMSAKDVKWLEQLAKIKGLYAPTKTAETDSEGNDVPKNITVTIVR